MFDNATNFYRKFGVAERRDLCVEAASWKCFSRAQENSEGRRFVLFSDLYWIKFFVLRRGSAGDGSEGLRCCAGSREQVRFTVAHG